MNRAALSNVWASVTAFLTFYALNAFYADRTNGKTLVDVPLLDKRVGAAVLFALLVCPIVGSVSLWLAIRFARRFGRASLASRIPIVGGLDLDFSEPDARAYQYFFLVAFILLPLGLQAHFVSQFLQRPAFDTAVCAEASKFKPVPPSVLGSNQYRYGNGTPRPDGCSGREEAQGVTFFPLYEPLFLLMLEVAYVLMFVWYTWTLLKHSERRSRRN